MPRILIRSLPSEGAIDIPSILKKLGQRLCKALDLPISRVTITWEIIPDSQFLFNGETAEFQPRSTHHPMADVTIVEGFSEFFKQTLAETITHTLGEELDIDVQNVCVVIHPLPKGNLFLTGEFK